MKRLLDLETLAAIALACSLTACDAPEKSVGQETDGSATSGTDSDSDTYNCGDGIAACTESVTDTIDPGMTGGETSGGPIDCSDADGPESCDAQDACIWLGSNQYPTSGEVCDALGGHSGFCAEIGDSAGPGCGLNCCSAPSDPYCDGGEYEVYFRSLGESWEVFRRYECAHAVPDGFISCNDDSAPAACDCECGTQAALPTGWETDLSAAGCADMTVYGGTADGSVGVVITTGLEFAPVAAAVTAGETLTTSHDVSEFSTVSVYTGDNVLYPECNDALDKNAYEIQEEWVATAGTITIEVVPEVDPPKFSTQGYATVTVTGLEVSYAGVTESVDEFVLSNIAVGWLPG